MVQVYRSDDPKQPEPLMWKCGDEPEAEEIFGPAVCSVCKILLDGPHVHLYDDDGLGLGAACSEACAIGVATSGVQSRER